MTHHCLCVASSLVLVAGCAGDDPGPPQPLPDLVYIERSGLGGNPDRLVRVAADGSNRRVLTVGPGSTLFSAVAASPDGQSVIYRIQANGPPEEVWFSIPADGGAPSPFPAPFGTLMDWSPDGRYLAWQVYNGVTNVLAISEPGSASVTVLTGDSLSLNDAYWSPDGTRLAFWAGSTSGDAAFLVDLQGHLTPLRIGGRFGTMPTWSRDGGKIVLGYSSASSPESTGVWTINADGTQPRMLSQGSWVPAWWSPVRDEVLMLGGRTLRITSARSGSARPISTLAHAGIPLVNPWSPDGRYVLWPVEGENRTLSVVSLSADGSDSVRVNPDTVYVNGQDWIPMH